MNTALNKKSDNIILASGSPRRIEMLRGAGFDPVVIKPQCEERLPEDIDMRDAVMFLALKKALWTEKHIRDSALYEENPLIIAADTIVYRNKIIGKPQNRQDGFEILSELRGKSHYVVSGVALLKAGLNVRRVFYDVTKVFFKSYTDEELYAYLDTDEPYDKAGGYAIQGTFAKYTDRVEGDINNVIGLPLSKTVEEIKKL